jgi:hypothetical protein
MLCLNNPNHKLEFEERSKESLIEDVLLGCNIRNFDSFIPINVLKRIIKTIEEKGPKSVFIKNKISFLIENAPNLFIVVYPDDKKRITDGVLFPLTFESVVIMDMMKLKLNSI